MAPTAVQYRDRMVAERGKPYWNKDARRLGPDMFDCSGLTHTKARELGVLIPTTSWTQALFCHAHGTDRVPLGLALTIPGMLLFKGANMGYEGYGAGGHVAGTIGDAVNVIEAKGTQWGVLVDDQRNGTHPWTNAAKVPGMIYAGLPGVPPTPGVGMQWMIEGHPTKDGYWCVDEVGHVFAYGEAEYHGGAGERMKAGKVDQSGAVVTLNGRVTSFAVTRGGGGYWLITEKGSIYTFGSAGYAGDPH